MLHDPTRFLLQNGALVLGAGVLCGVPFYLAIVLGWRPERIRAWRVAHATLLADGLLLLVVGALAPALDAGSQWREALAWSLVISGWGFVFALGGGAYLNVVTPSLPRPPMACTAASRTACSGSETAATRFG